MSFCDFFKYKIHSKNSKVFKSYLNKSNIKVEISNFNLKKHTLIFINPNLLNTALNTKSTKFKFYTKFVRDIMHTVYKIHIFTRKHSKPKCCKFQL